MTRQWLMAMVIGLAACNGKPDAPPTDGPSSQAIDPPVMAYLSMARARHHEANVAEAQGDAAGAISALEALTKADRPYPSARIPEIDEVLADTYARMAELELGRDGLDAAATDIRDGLAHATDASFFRGHLLEVQGIVEEARGNRLADAGHGDEAAVARKHAVELLHQAIAIQEQVVKQKTGGDR